MADFTNPGIFGDKEHFAKYFMNPILVGREPEAGARERDKAALLQEEMSEIVNKFIIRRMNTINARQLPDKLVQVVCCQMTDVQLNLYKHLMADKDIKSAVSGKMKDILSYIQVMQKLCNHPKILTMSGETKTVKLTKEELQCFGVPADGDASDPKAVFDIHPAISGKMDVLHRLMGVMRRAAKSPQDQERIVVISIFTQTLDLIEKMCHHEQWPVVRLDGKIQNKKRQEMVNAFNDPNNPNAFCFLLSSKAGGCGINLIGANRLVLFDSDWNPATDKQAAARCWRDGQKRKCVFCAIDHEFCPTACRVPHVYGVCGMCVCVVSGATRTAF